MDFEPLDYKEYIEKLAKELQYANPVYCHKLAQVIVLEIAELAFSKGYLEGLIDGHENNID